MSYIIKIEVISRDRVLNRNATFLVGGSVFLPKALDAQEKACTPTKFLNC